MNNLHIPDSYNTWNTSDMDAAILVECFFAYRSIDPPAILNRPYWTLYVEWWLHNIGYWITKPFIWYSAILSNINLRCKDVDLNEWK